MVLRTLISAAVLFAPLYCHPQTTAVDHLKHLATSAPNDSSKVSLLNALSSSLSDSDLNNALVHAQEAYSLSISLNDRQNQAAAAHNLSTLSFRRGELGTSFQHATEGLNISQEYGDNATVSRCLMNIATVYHEQKHYDLALNHYRRALVAAQEARNVEAEAYALNHIGSTWLCSGDADSAQFYAFRSLHLSREADIPYLQGYAHNTLGDIDLSRGNVTNAIDNFTRAAKLAKSNNKFLEVASLRRIGKAYWMKSEPDRALEPLLQSITMAENLGFSDELTKALRLTASVYAMQREIEKAFEYQSRYVKLHDARLEQRNNEQLILMQSNFETQLREAELEDLKKHTQLKEKELNNQQALMYFTVGLLGLTAMLAFALSYSNWAKQKANRILGRKNREIQKQAIQLSKLNITKDKLLSIISHDVRGPLASLRGLVNIICKGELTQSEFVENSVRLRQNLDTVQDDLDNLLYWAQSQLNGLLVNPEKIHVRNVVEDKIKLFKVAAERKEVTIVNEISDNLEVFVDRNHLGLIMRNLLANAIKFNSREGMIRIHQRIDGDEVAISVSDTGVGISQADLKKLFNAQTHFSNLGTAHEKGAGIGLLLTKEFIERNGGLIRVTSEPGKGSTFTFTIRLIPRENVTNQRRELSEAGR